MKVPVTCFFVQTLCLVNYYLLHAGRHGRMGDIKTQFCIYTGQVYPGNFKFVENV